MTNPIRLYHGCSKDSHESIINSAILGNTAPGYETRGAVFTSPRPDVAFAYACMLGGELNFTGGHLKDEDRVLLVLDIPADWYEKHFVRSVEGSCPEISFDSDIPAEFITNSVVGDRKRVYSYLAS